MKFSDDCRRISFYQTKVLKPAYLDPSSSISPVSLDGKNSPVNRESERKKNRKIFLFIFFFFLAKVRKFSRRSYLIEGEGAVRLSIERRFDLFVSD